MAKIEITHDFPHPADHVWRWVGDAAGVAVWIPAIDSSHLEGDVRHVVFTDGQPARERIVAHDDAGRTYSYQYLDDPLPLEHYVSTVVVDPVGDDGSQVVWSAEFRAASPEVEAGLATAISEIYASSLATLAERLG